MPKHFTPFSGPAADSPLTSCNTFHNRSFPEKCPCHTENSYRQFHPYINIAPVAFPQFWYDYACIIYRCQKEVRQDHLHGQCENNRRNTQLHEKNCLQKPEKKLKKRMPMHPTQTGQPPAIRKIPIRADAESCAAKARSITPPIISSDTPTVKSVISDICLMRKERFIIFCLISARFLSPLCWDCA